MPSTTASTDKTGNGTAIPVIWGTDAVHGHSNIIGATLFPHNVGLGAMRDPVLMAKIAAVTAAEVRVTGMDWTFAPAVSVPQDVRWGRSYEGYSEDPVVVASYVGVFVRGPARRAGVTRLPAPPARSRDDEALPCRRRHRWRPRPRRRAHHGDRAPRHSRLWLSASHLGGRSDRDGVVLQLERHEDHRQSRPAHRRAERPHGLSRASS